MSDISQKTLDKLEKQNITPKPRWQFLLKNYTMWVLGVLSIIVGSMAFSVIIFLATDHDWDAYALVDQGFFGLVLQALPYFWIVIMIAFGFVAFYNLRHTKGNYRYNAYIVFLLSIVFSMILGSALARAGFGQTLDKVFVKRIPMYEMMVKHRADMWGNPNKGLLGGKIIKVYLDNNNFDISGMHQEVWKVLAEEAQVAEKVEIELDEEVRLIGKILDFQNRIFQAKQIMPCNGQNGKAILPQLPMK